MLSNEEMIYDIWKCIMTDPDTGERYLNVRREPEPEIIIEPGGEEPLEPEPEEIE